MTTVERFKSNVLYYKLLITKDGFKHVYLIQNPTNLPLIRWVQFYRKYVQGVPRRNADSSEQTEQGDHGRLAVPKRQEKTADAGDHAGAGCRTGERKVS